MAVGQLSDGASWAIGLAAGVLGGGILVGLTILLVYKFIIKPRLEEEDDDDGVNCDEEEGYCKGGEAQEEIEEEDPDAKSVNSVEVIDAEKLKQELKDGTAVVEVPSAFSKPPPRFRVNSFCGEDDAGQEAGATDLDNNSSCLSPTSDAGTNDRQDPVGNGYDAAARASTPGLVPIEQQPQLPPSRRTSRSLSVSFSLKSPTSQPRKSSVGAYTATTPNLDSPDV